MKIITVKGEKNTGKSTLLKYAFKQLVADGADVIEYDCNDFLTDDFCAYLIWHGKKIVIYSIGDSAKYVEEGVKKANDWKVDILLNSLTNRVSLKKYRTLIPKTEISVDMLTKKDKEDRIQQKQRKYYDKILPELKK